MNIFNAQGQLNAGSLKDAFQTIIRYASILEDNVPSNATLSGQPGFNDSKRDDLITKALMTQEGKVALAQAIN